MLADRRPAGRTGCNTVNQLYTPWVTRLGEVAEIAVMGAFMARVAQAYFHFHTRLAEREMRKFGRKVDQAARRAALRNFGTAVLINVEIEEGSLIGRVTILLWQIVLCDEDQIVGFRVSLQQILERFAHDALSCGPRRPAQVGQVIEILLD